jgi:hypothetical protein
MPRYSWALWIVIVGRASEQAEAGGVSITFGKAGRSWAVGLPDASHCERSEAISVGP